MSEVTIAALAQGVLVPLPAPLLCLLSLAVAVSAAFSAAAGTKLVVVHSCSTGIADARSAPPLAALVVAEALTAQKLQWLSRVSSLSPAAPEPSSTVVSQMRARPSSLPQMMYLPSSLNLAVASDRAADQPAAIAAGRAPIWRRKYEA